LWWLLIFHRHPFTVLGSRPFPADSITSGVKRALGEEIEGREALAFLPNTRMNSAADDLALSSGIADAVRACRGSESRALKNVFDANVELMVRRTQWRNSGPPLRMNPWSMNMQVSLSPDGLVQRIRQSG